jgi:histidine triad (HIT) family protein
VAGCVFCGIVAGTVDAVVVEDGRDGVVFLDARPVFKGHALVVPREHIEVLTDLPESALAPLFGLVRRVAGAVESALGAGGTFVALNHRVSQRVPHLHVHVVPRTKGDGLRGFFWPRTKYDSPEEARSYAEKIRAAL